MYNIELTWAQISNRLGDQARNTIAQMTNCDVMYDKWQSIRAGRTNAEIAIALGKTEFEIAEMDSAFAAFYQLYQYATNQSNTAGDYFYSLRKFSEL